MKYYYCDQINTFYKIGYEQGQKKIYTCNLNNPEWTNIPIVRSKTGFNTHESTLDLGMENTEVVLIEPNLHTMPNFVTLKLTTFGNSKNMFESTQQTLTLTEVPIERIQQHFPQFKKEPEQSGLPKIISTPSQHPRKSSAFFERKSQEYEHIKISPDQHKALTDHLQTLRDRWFEYHILSYIFFCFSCFSHGFSRTEKIDEITRLLNTGEARSEVVRQGHTGSILRMQ